VCDTKTTEPLDHESEASLAVARTINRIHDVTTVTTLDRITGKATVESFIGDSPYGK
jgi:hypothetical protein